MGPNISFSVDTKELEMKLHELAKYARVAPGEVMRYEVKKLSEILIKLTPPSTFAQGRKAVAEDLKRVYTTVPALIKHAEENGRIEDIAGFEIALKKAYKKGDEAAVEKLLTGPVGPHETQVKGYTRNGKQVKSYTAKRPGRPVFPQVMAGHTKVGGPLNPSLHVDRRTRYGKINGQVASQIVKPGELKAYQRKIQSRVGWHASGWAAMAIQAGFPVPAWILKQSLVSASGMASMNFGENPYVRAVNRKVKIPRYQQIVNGAVDSRWRDTHKKIERLLAGKATNLGFTRIAAK
jgi:hypothetical protein